MPHFSRIPKHNSYAYLNKITDIQFLQCDVEIQRNITSSWYFPLVLMLCAEPKTKVTKETENTDVT